MKQLEKYAPMFLYLLLALGLSLSVLAAAGCYAEVSDLADRGASARVSGQFVRMKTWQSDGARAEGGHVLLAEEYPEGTFRNALYNHDGWLMEQLAADGVGLDPAMGDRILPCAVFYADADGDLITVVSDHGRQYIYARAGEGAAP